MQIKEVCDRVLVESDGESGGKRIYRAKISHVNRVNGNRRWLSREEATKAITRVNPLLSAGRITGALDHVGPMEGGSLKNTAGVWKSFTLEADDSVTGTFTILETSRGADLRAMIAGGVSVGLSTIGYANLRPASAKEKALGIPGDVMIYEDFRITGVDFVGDPSCADSAIFESRARERRTAAEKVAAELLQCTIHQEELLPECVHRLESGEAPDRVLAWSKGADESLSRRAVIRSYRKAV